MALRFVNNTGDSRGTALTKIEFKDPQVDQLEARKVPLLQGRTSVTRSLCGGRKASRHVGVGNQNVADKSIQIVARGYELA